MVEAASVNGFDLSVAGGYVWDMLPHEFPVVLGRDFVGIVTASTMGVTAEQLGRDDITVTTIMAAATADKLARLLDDLAGGKLRVNIEATVPLERAHEALQTFADGTLGKVLVTR